MGIILTILVAILTAFACLLFNVVYRDDPAYEVVAFTAVQIEGIAHRRYPHELAGALYPHGIPIIQEHTLEAFRGRHRFDQVVFAYSDVTHAQVMHLASRALALGADFVLLGPQHTMLRAAIPVIAVSAVRTGCGKSQTARWLSALLRRRGLRVAVMRHPIDTHHPGEAVLRMADVVVVVAKSGGAAAADVRQVMHNVRRINARAAMMRAGSPVRLDDAAAVKGKRVLVIADGPATTHGGMAHGAGFVAATRAEAREIVDPRRHAVPQIASVYDTHRQLSHVLPAMGYSAAQLAALEQTINATPADVVVSATPIDLAALIHVNKPVVCARALRIRRIGRPRTHRHCGRLFAARRSHGARGLVCWGNFMAHPGLVWMINLSRHSRAGGNP